MGYIAIVDYGAGNLKSVQNSLDFVGAQSRIATTERCLEDAAGILLPGVGAFDDAVRALHTAGLMPALVRNAMHKPFLGICLGMQLLFERSDEGAPCEGLGLLPGHIARIQTPYKLPQIGWNSLCVLRPNALTEGIDAGEHVYFVHSYAAVPAVQEDLACVTEYGGEVAAMVARGQLFGCQFHPEKSGAVGLHILKNFVKVTEGKA